MDMNNVKSVLILDNAKKDYNKYIVYAPNTDDMTIDEGLHEEIMKSLTQSKNEFFKFKAEGIEGAEKIKNDTHIWCDYEYNLWQIPCGRVRDMNNIDIPNTFYVRNIGCWTER